MKSKNFLLSVVLPLLALIALLVVIAGCEPPQGSAPAPRPVNPPCVKVLAFTASWCVPCQRAKPALVQIKASGVDVQIIDIDKQPELARQYGVSSVPAFFVYVCGREAVRTQDISVVVSLTRSKCK
jgi:thiol-disulfide isomerase/thioredoxin